MDSKDKAALAVRLGARIAELRMSADMTQADLASRLEIGDEHVSRFERGAVLPTLPRLIDVAEVFELTGLDDLVLRASPRIDDEAAWMANRIHKLPLEERALIKDTVDRLAGHFEWQLRDWRGKR